MMDRKGLEETFRLFLLVSSAYEKANCTKLQGAKPKGLNLTEEGSRVAENL